ncbi:MAG: bifunctional diaminohydroxyphosphoribosylaminopyrimidine deaminase/5-amino-6-(5-phosphoribosylamino)uracil reductase RibD [Methylophilaceae bacterium]|nr:bifunctional diaminohydroxyphosphoribosylaminopyrimidine deaminase/5-amino-6-(5-phosphoribosylamino)uracil reductase RibD [Methylophilaceae bacterium]
MFDADDHRYMSRALQLAVRGLDTTMPNPRVGCVIVKEGVIVGEGWHECAGGPHAEIRALDQAGAAARGATVYVTLEPCSHHGRTPPCADALIAAGVARVIAAMRDPNPKVAGSGLARLHAHGIGVSIGLLEAQARELNAGFISRMERGRPWLRSKIAASLDGATALQNGASQWITGTAARQDVQRWRARASAILTGVGTILADDPLLTVRDLEVPRQPLRIVVDGRLRTPPTARILRDGGVLVACCDDGVPNAGALRTAGAEVIALPGEDGRVDLAALLAELARREINELQVEAGARLNGALLHQRLIDELLLYFAPTVLGTASRGMFDIPVLTAIKQRIDLDILSLDRIGQDIRIRARPLYAD